MVKFSYKLFKVGGGVMLAIADFSILGKTLSEGDIQIDIRKEFYSEKNCSESELPALIKGVTIINAIGNDIVSFLVKMKIVDESNVLYVKGVAHAQVIAI